MVVVQHNRDQVDVVSIAGVLGVGGDGGLHALVQGLVSEGRRQIVVDMADVPHVDSTGIATLIAMHTTVTRAGGRLILVSLDRRVERVLAVTRLLTIFDHAENVEAARAAFAA